MTGEEIDYITHDKLPLLLKNNMRGGLSSLLGNCYVKDEKVKIL